MVTVEFGENKQKKVVAPTCNNIRSGLHDELDEIFATCAYSINENARAPDCT